MIGRMTLQRARAAADARRMAAPARGDGPVFLGLDLAWGERNPSGAIALRDRGDGTLSPIAAAQTLTSDDTILQWLDEHAPHGPAVLAIDAPLIAPNAPGTCRPCDRRVTGMFGKYHAGAYPANREVAARAIGLARRLTDAGWSLDPAQCTSGERCAIEVYPHPATIGLFGLDRIVKYKKGRAQQRRQGLGELLDLLRRELPTLQPRISAPPHVDVDKLTGRRHRDFEDQLDAWICAAMAAVFHARPQDCDVIGDLATGYIVVPKLPVTA